MSRPKPSPEFVELCKAYWITRLFYWLGNGRALYLIPAVVLFFALISAPCFWASWVDGTLYLEKVNRGKGLMEHPAFWALFVGGPTFALLFFVLFKRMTGVVEHFCAEGTQRYAPECRNQVLDLLACRTPALRVVLYSMMLLGSYAVIANYQNTKRPIAVFRQDVWDSIYHNSGFIVAKLFLAFQWIYLYPLAIYLGLAASAAILLIVNRLVARQRIEILPFEPDGCGGYRPLGQAMLVVVYLNAPFVLFVTADIYTHKTFYLALLMAIVLVVTILLFEIFAPFVRLHKLLAAGKTGRLQELNSLISQKEQAVANEESKAPPLLSILATIEIFKQTQRMHTWPYLPIDRLKWLTPLIPIALGILKRLTSP